MILSVFVLVFFAGYVGAFSTVPQTPHRFLALRSEPSDTSSDVDRNEDFLTVETQDFLPTATEATVTTLLDIMPSSLGEISDTKRSSINEVILKLESLNPTEQPARSSLVNGVWELRYAAGYTSDWAVASPTRQLALFLYSGGYSPGLFALAVAKKLPSSLVDINDLEISISREQPRVQANVEFTSIFGSVSVEVKAELQVESDVRLRETYESTSVLGRSVEFPGMFRYSRALYVTYVDEDILIIRDDSGVPELLVRKEKSFSRNWGTDPSDIV